MKNKKVLFGGAFDIFHWMHLKSIEQAKSHGGYIVVAVNSDRLIKEYKGKDPIFTENERMEIIKNLKFVDEVILKDKFDDIDLIKDYNIDVFVIGDEWPDKKQSEKELIKSLGVEMIVMPYLYAERMPKVKERVKWLLEQKQKVLC